MEVLEQKVGFEGLLILKFFAAEDIGKIKKTNLRKAIQRVCRTTRAYYLPTKKSTVDETVWDVVSEDTFVDTLDSIVDKHHAGMKSLVWILNDQLDRWHKSNPVSFAMEDTIYFSSKRS